ncbi:MAG: hypothetical protein M3082_06560 [Candidatus Dormibacteraeota bacterium]|nr:hypothetical protein [Candidatus Dormibacteraeota bacterium]
MWVGGRVSWRTISLFGLNFFRPRDTSQAELAADREDQKAAAGAGRRQLEVAFRRYAEAAVGVVPMIGRPTSNARRRPGRTGGTCRAVEWLLIRERADDGKQGTRDEEDWEAAAIATQFPRRPHGSPPSI